MVVTLGRHINSKAQLVMIDLVSKTQESTDSMMMTIDTWRWSEMEMEVKMEMEMEIQMLRGDSGLTRPSLDSLLPTYRLLTYGH